jgi:hypothetical protein
MITMGLAQPDRFAGRCVLEGAGALFEILTRRAAEIADQDLLQRVARSGKWGGLSVGGRTKNSSVLILV